jgi:hypothetical protein
VSAFYAYAVVRGSFDPAGAPSGIDDGPVSIVRSGDIAAIVTPIDETKYDPALVAEHSQDLEWLAARASAHDRVMTWAVDHATVIPLPLFSLFYDAAGVQQMLARRRAELDETLQRLGDAREYTVRVYRLDQTLLASLSTHSREIADLESRAAQSSPGQRYLLDRKLEHARRAELERVSHEVAKAAFMALAAIARNSARDTVTSQPAAAGHAVLNASFLIAAPEVETFRGAVTELIADLGPRGFRFEFTGPWAPYHFVGASDDSSAAPTAGATPQNRRST